MATYTISNIQSAVRVVLDKNTMSALLSDLVDTDTLNVNEIILASIPRAVRNVHAVAPPDFLDDSCTKTSTGEVKWNTGGKTGYVELDSDFLRFLSFKMSDWERTVYEPITPDNPLYAQQKSRWAGVRGTPEKPVCALSLIGGKAVIEFFSCKNQTATCDLRYVTLPAVSEGSIPISARCYDAVVYEAAALTATSLNDATLSAMMRAEANKLLLLNTDQATS